MTRTIQATLIHFPPPFHPPGAGGGTEVPGWHDVGIVVIWGRLFVAIAIERERKAKLVFKEEIYRFLPGASTL